MNLLVIADQLEQWASEADEAGCFMLAEALSDACDEARMAAEEEL